MTALSVLARRTTPIELVIFDCDGVLVDSENLANRIVAEELQALGWPITPQEANGLFLGLSLADMLPIMVAHLGHSVPGVWLGHLQKRLIRAMQSEVEAIPGALDALEGISRLDLPWRIASNSSHAEMRVKFARIGADQIVAGRVHSVDDVARGKPSPDLFLAAAAASGSDPAACIVVEDSLPGCIAARAAGMDCLGFAPHGDDPALRSAGAGLFLSMFELPELIGQALRAR